MRLRLFVSAAACGSVIAACAPTVPSPRDILFEARAVKPDSAGHFKPISRSEIANLLARIGEYDEALATARQDTAFFWMNYMALAQVRAGRGDVSGAESMLNATITPQQMSRARPMFAADVAVHGDTLDAFRIARSLPDSDAVNVRLGAAGWLIERGELARAESAIISVRPSGVYLGDMWGHLANAYYSHGDESQGNRVAKLADERWGLDRVRMKLVAQRDWREAIAIANAKPLTQRYDYFEDLAQEMASRKDTARETEAFDDAEKAAMAVDDDLTRLFELSVIAAAERQLSRPQSAAALMVVPDMTRPHRGHPDIACEVVSAFARADRLKDVMDVLRRGDCSMGEYFESRDQFYAGDVDGAIRTVEKKNRPGLVAMRLEGWIQMTTAKSDMPQALRLFAILETKGAAYDNEVSYAAAAIVRGMARTDPSQALTWARARRTSTQKVAALTELARVMINKQDSIAPRPLPAH